MIIHFDIKCSDYTNTPAYRVWVNDELMLERDFAMPSAEFSHYKFQGFMDCETADVRIESCTPGVTFEYKNLELIQDEMV